jgi:hypothetical protein
MDKPLPKIALLEIPITLLPQLLNLPFGIEAESASIDQPARTILLQVTGNELPVAPWKEAGRLEILRPQIKFIRHVVPTFECWK